MYELKNNMILKYGEKCDYANIINSNDIQNRSLQYLKRKIKKLNGFLLFIDLNDISDLILFSRKIIALYMYCNKNRYRNW